MQPDSSKISASESEDSEEDAARNSGAESSASNAFKTFRTNTDNHYDVKG